VSCSAPRALAALCLAGVLGAAPAASAQAGARPDAVPPGAPYERARTLVEHGRGDEGRALVDSLVGAAESGSPAYAEALWWRAALARDVAGAERDLRTLVTELPASPRAVEAALRLAQLDLARGRPADARERLERLRREQPDGGTRALAAYWLARAQLDAGDARTACAMLNEAAGGVLPGDPAARQLVALRRRLPGCELTVAIGSAVGAREVGAPAGAADTPPGGPPRVPDSTTADPAPTRGEATPSASPPASPSAEPSAAPSATARGGFTVQVAAYDRREPAEQAAARLLRRGVEARVSGTAAPFRVRVGRVPSRAAAAALQRELAAKGLRGFVTEAEPPTP
jgi:cell division septation protein DedD